MRNDAAASHAANRLSPHVLNEAGEHPHREHARRDIFDSLNKDTIFSLALKYLFAVHSVLVLVVQVQGHATEMHVRACGWQMGRWPTLRGEGAGGVATAAPGSVKVPRTVRER